jgi:hypothetical protein
MLVMFGDDIGITNVSAYSDGLMGYTTPNIDRMALQVCASYTTTRSRVAPQAASHSSRASTASAPA